MTKVSWAQHLLTEHFPEFFYYNFSRPNKFPDEKHPQLKDHNQFIWLTNNHSVKTLRRLLLIQ